MPRLDWRVGLKGCLAAVVVGLVTRCCSIPLLAADDDGAVSALRPENALGPGHSMQGESFDEGPRRAATLLGTTGRVTFPITTAVPLAQQFFNQGIGQLHGYWYFEAERSFRQAAKIDPDCAMTYYGMALANVNNDRRARGFIEEAVKRKSNASDRERLYIEALSAWHKADAGDREKKKTRVKEYLKALEEIIYQYPDDLEAKAHLCFVLTKYFDDLNTPGAVPLDALAKEILAVNPFHPVHHYRIHLWDNDKARMAVNSAERCGLSAPGIAHMWHMSGHTYSELNQYFDAIWHQEASARTDHAYMIREGIFPDRIHNFAHNNEWLARNLQFVGRVHDSIAISRNAIELPRHPTLNPFPGEKSAHYGRLRLFQAYTQFELWDRLIADAKTPILGPTTDELEQIKCLRSLGRAYFRSRDDANGRIQLGILEERLSCLLREEAGKSQAKTDPAKQNSKTSEKQKSLESAIAELQSFEKLLEGKPDQALELLVKAQGIDEAWLAEVEIRAGKQEAALERLRSWARKNKNQVRPLAALTETLWTLNQKEDARQVFESLREISGAIDLDIPPFARLHPIATQLGYSIDWRKPRPMPRNSAELPELATLGPFTWQPVAAPSWSLPDGTGVQHSLTEYQGKPVILVFYLGYGCLHCAEQLKAFVTRREEFTAAGISLAAISSDDIATLKRSQERYNAEGVFPFLLVSDAQKAVFKRYQAYDDFEDAALHATVLIDGAGRIRWHDVGPEPFMNLDFLLEESKRLLYPDRQDISLTAKSRAACGSSAAQEPDRSPEAVPAKSLPKAPGCN